MMPRTEWPGRAGLLQGRQCQYLGQVEQEEEGQQGHCGPVDKSLAPMVTRAATQITALYTGVNKQLSYTAIYGIGLLICVGY